MAETLANLLAALLLIVSGVVGHRYGKRQGAFALVAAVGAHLLIASLSASGIAMQPGADNLTFHLRATLMAAGAIEPSWSFPSSFVWPSTISLVYGVFGSSIWLGYVVNLWFFLLACVQLVKFCIEIGASRFKWQTLLLFALVPSSLLFANFLLRESFQILLLIIIVRYLNKYRETGRFANFMVAFVAFIPFGAIHNGFFLFGPVAFAYTFLARKIWAPDSPLRGRAISAVLAAMVGVGIFAGGLAAFSDTDRVGQILEGEIDTEQSLMDARERGANTVFPWGTEGGIVSSLIFSPVLVLQFVAAPIIPFIIKAPSHLVAGLDSAIRLLCLWGCLLTYRAADRDQKSMLIFLLGLYLLFCVVAAMGTRTVGTALRHHLKMFWVIMAIGVPGLLTSARARRRRIREIHRWQHPIPTAAGRRVARIGSQLHSNRIRNDQKSAEPIFPVADRGEHVPDRRER